MVKDINLNPVELSKKDDDVLIIGLLVLLSMIIFSVFGFGCKVVDLYNNSSLMNVNLIEIVKIFIYVIFFVGCLFCFRFIARLINEKKGSNELFYRDLREGIKRYVIGAGKKKEQITLFNQKLSAGVEIDINKKSDVTISILSLLFSSYFGGKTSNTLLLDLVSDNKVLWENQISDCINDYLFKNYNNFIIDYYLIEVADEGLEDHLVYSDLDLLKFKELIKEALLVVNGNAEK